jgi:hypothetical protein
MQESLTSIEQLENELQMIEIQVESHDGYSP